MAALSNGRPLVLVADTVLDGTGAEPIHEGTVQIADGQVAWVGPTASAPSAPADAEVLELPGTTVMPGLIDAHTHIMYNRYASAVEIDSKDSLEGATINAIANAQRLLLAGFTTIRDVGSRGTIAVAVRDGIQDGTLTGPRIYASGRIVSTTSGLADFLSPWLTNASPFGLIADGPDRIRKAVRTQVKEGVDVIKLEASGHAISRAGGTEMATMSEDEIRAAVEEAHKYGKRVAIHAQSRPGIYNALRAGVDTLEHGSDMDDGCIDLLRETGITYVPTVSNIYSYTEAGSALGVSDSIIAEVAKSEAAWVGSVKLAHAAGIRIAMGSDVGNRYPNGQNAVEMEMLVRSGMSPAEVIVSSTQISAEAVGVQHERGTLTPGLAADVIAVAGNPLDDITVFQDNDKVVLVAKDGVIHKRTAG
jgi:imidazolonepropionase-like amidohydrolase